LKRYSDYNHASVSMSAGEDFKKAIGHLFSTEPIEYIFESGTFDGSGSTTTLAKAVQQNRLPVKTFVTAEVDYRLYRKARKNLEAFPFVTPRWGMTVNYEEAKAFIKQDEAILHHDRYPDIFIDDVEDPQGFYLNELSGQLSKHHLRQSWLSRLSQLFEKRKEPFTENLFQEHLPAMASGKTLVLLDSAGGVGYLEFQKVQEIMKNKTYFLILDDIHHLKHFRSYAHLQQGNGFRILNDNPAQGWVLAKKEGGAV